MFQIYINLIPYAFLTKNEQKEIKKFCYFIETKSVCKFIIYQQHGLMFRVFSKELIHP